MPSLNTSSINSQADNIGTDFATATLVIYSGTPPLDADTPLSGNVALATHTLTGWGTAVAGVITASNLPDTQVIAATGTATFARLELLSNTMQVTAGTGAQELVLSSTSYTAGEDSTINSLTIIQPSS